MKTPRIVIVAVACIGIGWAVVAQETVSNDPPTGTPDSSSKTEAYREAKAEYDSALAAYKSAKANYDTVAGVTKLSDRGWEGKKLGPLGQFANQMNRAEAKRKLDSAEERLERAKDRLNALDSK